MVRLASPTPNVSRLAALLVPVCLLVSACAPSEPPRAERDPDVVQTALHDFKVVTFVDGLMNPSGMVFTPEGDLLVTERSGYLRIVREGVLLPDPVEGIPDVIAIGKGARKLNSLEQAGMRDVRLDPDFERNRTLYLSYVKPGADSLGSIAVSRARFENDRLTDVQEIFHAQAFADGSDHSSMWGGKLAIDGNGYLYLTLGDRQWPARGDLSAHPAQDLSNHNGTTIRIRTDGRVPDDNPFVDTPGALPEIWSYGHRNAQGFALNPATGDLWSNEHGPQGGDELNLILAGRNYGWPVIGFGVNYTTGKAIHEGTHHEGMEQPAYVWVPSIGVSGLIFYEGDVFPEWRGDVLVGGMSGQRLDRLRLDGTRVVRHETLVQGIGRVRDVQQDAAGYVYLALDGGTRWEDGPPTAILRLEPAGMR